MPEHLAAGVYTVTYCNDPCTTGLGDLIGGSVAVGVDPPTRVPREWPSDHPEIANLAADALLSGPGYRVTAAEVRAPPPAVAAGSDDDPPVGTLLLLATSVLTAGAVVGLQRRCAAGLGSTPARSERHVGVSKEPERS